MICLYENQVFKIGSQPDLTFVVTKAGQKTPEYGPNVGKTIWWVEAIEFADHAIVKGGSTIGFPQEGQTVEVVGAYTPVLPDEGETGNERIFVVIETKDYGYDGQDVTVVGLNRTHAGAVERIKRASAAHKLNFESVVMDGPDAFMFLGAKTISEADITYEIRARAIGA